MICLAAFRRSNLSISSLLCARNATPLLGGESRNATPFLGGESRNATPFLGDYCHFSTSATSGSDYADYLLLYRLFFSFIVDDIIYLVYI